MAEIRRREPDQGDRGQQHDAQQPLVYRKRDLPQCQAPGGRQDPCPCRRGADHHALCGTGFRGDRSSGADQEHQQDQRKDPCQCFYRKERERNRPGPADGGHVPGNR